MGRKFCGEADATVKLDTVAGDFSSQARDVLFGGQRIDERLTVVGSKSGGVLDKSARGDEGRLVVGNPMLERLKLADQHAELFAYFHILNRRRKNRFATTLCVGGKCDTGGAGNRVVNVS